jgi:hypothetical protein
MEAVLAGNDFPGSNMPYEGHELSRQRIKIQRQSFQGAGPAGTYGPIPVFGDYQTAYVVIVTANQYDGSLAPIGPDLQESRTWNK